MGNKNSSQQQQQKHFLEEPLPLIEVMQQGQDENEEYSAYCITRDYHALYTKIDKNEIEKVLPKKLGINLVGEKGRTGFGVSIVRPGLHDTEHMINKEEMMVTSCSVLNQQIPVTAEMYSTEGQEMYASLKDQYLRMGDCFVVVINYDQENVNHTVELEGLMYSIRFVRDTTNVPLVVVGINRPTGKQETHGQDQDTSESKHITEGRNDVINFCKVHKLPYYETEHAIIHDHHQANCFLEHVTLEYLHSALLNINCTI